MPIGRFSYTRSQPKLYAVGIDRVENADKTGVLIASSEKALCDKLIFTRNLNFRSPRALQELLFDDLRIDEDSMARFDPEVIRACMAAGLKTDMLRALMLMVNGLQRDAS